MLQLDKTVEKNNRIQVRHRPIERRLTPRIGFDQSNLQPGRLLIELTDTPEIKVHLQRIPGGHRSRHWSQPLHTICTLDVSSGPDRAGPGQRERKFRHRRLTLLDHHPQLIPISLIINRDRSAVVIIHYAEHLWMHLYQADGPVRIFHLGQRFRTNKSRTHATHPIGIEIGRFDGNQFGPSRIRLIFRLHTIGQVRCPPNHGESNCRVGRAILLNRAHLVVTRFAGIISLNTRTNRTQIFHQRQVEGIIIEQLDGIPTGSEQRIGRPFGLGQAQLLQPRCHKIDPLLEGYGGIQVQVRPGIVIRIAVIIVEGESRDAENFVSDCRNVQITGLLDGLIAGQDKEELIVFQISQRIHDQDIPILQARTNRPECTQQFRLRRQTIGLLILDNGLCLILRRQPSIEAGHFCYRPDISYFLPGCHARLLFVDIYCPKLNLLAQACSKWNIAQTDIAQLPVKTNRLFRIIQLLIFNAGRGDFQLRQVSYGDILCCRGKIIVGG